MIFLEKANDLQASVKIEIDCVNAWNQRGFNELRCKIMHSLEVIFSIKMIASEIHLYFFFSVHKLKINEEEKIRNKFNVLIPLNVTSIKISTNWLATMEKCAIIHASVSDWHNMTKRPRDDNCILLCIEIYIWCS